MEFRNSHEAFGGSFEMLPCEDGKLEIVRKNGNAKVLLKADFKQKDFEIYYTENESQDLVKYSI